MGKNNFSYAEAYTDFLKYCSERKHISIDILVEEFKRNGVEKDFRELYNKGIKLSNSEYYKRITR